MARIARIVVPNCPHHVVQRGNRRQQVFFNNEDKLFYLRRFSELSKSVGVDVWAYCLMDNHVHFIIVPKEEIDLVKVFARLHERYTRRINFRNGWRGYLWQGRFCSCPMDNKHTLAAVKYVENNPVRVGMVAKAENYLWSSARAHVFGIEDEILCGDDPIKNEITDWRSYLEQESEKDFLKDIRKTARGGRPLGDHQFIRYLEKLTGRTLLEPVSKQQGDTHF